MCIRDSVYIDDAYAASNSEKANVKANAYFLDGTNEEITVDKVGGSSVKGEACLLYTSRCV